MVGWDPTAQLPECPAMAPLLQDRQSAHSQGISVWGRGGFHPQASAICLFSSLKKLFYLFKFVICPVTFQCLFKRNSNLLPNCFSQLFFVTCINVEEARTKNRWNKQWWKQV